MRQLVSIVLVIGLTPLFTLRAAELPETTLNTVRAWTPSLSDAQRIERAAQLGPLDAPTLAQISQAGEQLQRSGKYADALQYFDFCAWSARRASYFLEASVCTQLTGGTERLMGRYVESEKDYREALELASNPGVTKRVPLILNNLASLYGSQARYSEALEMLGRVIAANDAGGVKDDAAPFQNRAIVYALQGDLARSLEQFLVALHIYEAQHDENKIALVHHNMGALQMKQSNYEAAEKEMLTALPVFEKKGDKSAIAQSLSDLGHLRDLQGRNSEALELLTRGVANAKAINFRPGYGDALANLGNFHQSHQEWAAARASFDEARQVFEELHDDNDLSSALRGLGLVSLRLGSQAEALAYADKAVETAHRIGDLQGEWQSLALVGEIARSSSDHAKARAAFARSIQLIDTQRGMVAGGDLDKQRFFEEAAYPYREYALLLADDGGFPALQAAERTRARVLVDVLETGPDRLENFLTAADQKEERRFHAQLSGLNARISRSAPTAIPGLVAERDEVWTTYQTFLAGILVRDPRLSDWQGTAPPLNEPDLATLTNKPGAVVIEYLCGRDETLLFTVTRGPHVKVTRIPIGRVELTARIARFRRLVESRDPGFRAEARALYNLLLPKNTTSGARRVSLVPDGPLWDLPFQALVSPAGRYWIEDVNISFAPSLTFLSLSANHQSSPFAKDLLAFGDPQRRDTASVPVLRDQVKRISALYDPAKSSVQYGSAATEKQFRADAPGARVIHVAAHGIMDSRNALHSRIMLTGTGDDDGWIEAWELMRMGLHADLAVFSACETGRGRVAEGEGLVGLTWALFVSGVRDTVVSQWKVESESTSQLMVGMHRGLRAGQPPSTALRAAILDLMKDERYRHPMYWAAFVAAGRDVPLTH